MPFKRKVVSFNLGHSSTQAWLTGIVDWRLSPPLQCKEGHRPDWWRRKDPWSLQWQRRPLPIASQASVLVTDRRVSPSIKAPSAMAGSYNNNARYRHNDCYEMQTFCFRCFLSHRSKIVSRWTAGSPGDVSFHSRLGAELRYSSARGPRSRRHQWYTGHNIGTETIQRPFSSSPMNIEDSPWFTVCLDYHRLCLVYCFLFLFHFLTASLN